MWKMSLITLCAGLLILTIFVSCDESGTTGYEENDSETTISENAGTHEDSSDYVPDTSNSVEIVLNGDSISGDADGISIDGSTVSITAGGVYSISGTLSDGQIIVDAADSDVVYLLLNGVNITCSDNAPINIVNAEKVIIELVDGSENSLTDGSNYTLENDDDEPNAALFSKTDLTIFGGGSLTVDANYNDAIASKDGLIIDGTTINLTSVDDGIRGKDYLVIRDASISMTVSGDGLKSDNDEDAEKGYISIESGTFVITAGNDAIQAETDVIISGGTFTIKTGGGSSAYLSDSVSAKGIKATVILVIDDGTFSLNCADDGIHSNQSIAINGGTYTISSGDDGIHGDSVVEINGGTITITKCYEGIESANLTINDGTIRLSANDDGLNGAGNNTNYLTINGGYILVNAIGDGVDVNGTLVMNGGLLLVNGPTSNGNGAIDYDVSFKMNGGTFIAVGSAGMAQTASSTSSQNAVLMRFSATKSAGTICHVEDSNGAEIFTFAPLKTYQSVAFSTPDLSKGSSYKVYTGGSYSTSATDGYYSGGTYTAGTQLTSFSVSSTVTSIYK